MDINPKCSVVQAIKYKFAIAICAFASLPQVGIIDVIEGDWQ